MPKIFSLFLATFLSIGAVAQSIAFTGRDADGKCVELNRVEIANLSKGWQGTLYWPDTVLTTDNVEQMAEFPEDGGLFLAQNNPNPFENETEVLLTTAYTGGYYGGGADERVSRVRL